MNILDYHVKSLPSDQNALNVFKGEWSSKFPGSNLTAGNLPLFEDTRITWAEQQFNGFKDQHILELGPLEGGHSYMLEKMGASTITAVESNTHAYIRCLITKEILQLHRVRFLLGDFMPFLKNASQRYDACIASGVLYHMQNPAELIQLISEVSDKIFLWTHYFDAELIKANPKIEKNKFSVQEESIHQGFKHTLYRYNYKAALEWTGFCGGSADFSFWMSRQDILACLYHFGFKTQAIHGEKTHHVNGPCFCVAASKIIA